MRIIIATGGTGGHVFPALDVAAELARDGHEILFLGVFGKGPRRVIEQSYLFEELPARGFRGSSWGAMISSGAKIIRATHQSFRTIGRFRPDVVVGFGGYAAFPVVLAAVCRRIPTLVHEQNVIPGRANALLSRWVDEIAISFEQSKKYFPSVKTVFTGCPCRLKPGVDRTVAYQNFGLKEGRPTILVFGGSQGARAINQTFEKMLLGLQGDFEFQVIHLAGSEDLKRLQGCYSKLRISYFLTDFLEEIDQAYGIADLVISRAGALTITELAAFKIPAILVPYPYAGGHQLANAQVLEQTGLARVIEQRDLNHEGLRKEILNILSQGFLTEELTQAASQIFKPKAAALIASEAARLGRG